MENRKILVSQRSWIAIVVREVRASIHTVTEVADHITADRGQQPLREDEKTVFQQEQNHDKNHDGGQGFPRGRKINKVSDELHQRCASNTQALRCTLKEKFYQRLNHQHRKDGEEKGNRVNENNKNQFPFILCDNGKESLVKHFYEKGKKKSG